MIGPYAIERDYSQYVTKASAINYAVIGTATRGPIGVPTLCTNTTDLLRKFGPASPDHLALYAANYYLNAGSTCYFVRCSHKTTDGQSVIPTATVATGIIKGTVGGVENSNVITINSVEPGTFFNGIIVRAEKKNGSAVDSMIYLLKVYNSANELLESKQFDVANDDPEYFSSAYIKIVSVVSTATALSEASVVLSGGTDGATTVVGAGIKATAAITGVVNSAGADVMTFEAKEAGNFFNGIKLSATLKTGTTYTIKVYTPAGVELESTDFDLSSDAVGSFDSAYVTMTAKEATATAVDTDAVSLSGGVDPTSAISIESTDYVYYAQGLKSVLVDMNLFSMPGVTDKTAIASMLQLAEDRGDCMFLVDPPKDCDTPDKVRAWADGTAVGSGNRLVSSYGALYWSWQWILDNGKKVLVPPSVVLGYTFAKSARDTELWFPVAGVQRGLVSGIYEPVYAPSQEEVQGLYEQDEAVNCIINDPTYGPCIWGQKTLLRGNTSLNRVNVRMLLNYLKKVIVAACKYLTFEPNDQVTWNQFEDMVEPTLSSIGNRRGMYEYKIVKGESLVTSDDIDNYRMPCKILIKPTKVAEEIPIYFVITSTGADFNNILEAEGIVEV